MTSAIIAFGFGTALLEGVGLSFIIPIVEVAQQTGDPAEADGIEGIFATVYRSLGIPLRWSSSSPASRW